MIYSKRFIIRSMLLVGATEAFIRKPILVRSLVHGFISAFLAIGLLSLITFFAVDQMPELLELEDPMILLILVILIFLLGAALSWTSTWLSVRKYLRISTDLLYT